MIATFIYIAIGTFVIYLIYSAVNKRVERSLTLKDSDFNTSLKEFRESNAVSTHINGTAFYTSLGIVRKYELMCIIDPVTYRNNPEIPTLIKLYKDIISGKVPDEQGLNIPSEELLGKHNPDYDKYLQNQSKALKANGSIDQSNALYNERGRVVRIRKEQDTRNQFFTYLIEQDIPALIVSAALNSDVKLNTFNEDDWRSFCKSVKRYLEVSPHSIVMSFVELFNEKDILFDTDKFAQYAIYSIHGVPDEITSGIIKQNITIDQASRMLDLTEQHQYRWEDALREVLTEDIYENESYRLRKQYGWKG